MVLLSSRKPRMMSYATSRTPISFTSSRARMRGGGTRCGRHNRGAMGELKAPFEVDPIGSRKVCMATAWNVSGREIREKVATMLEQPSQMIARYQVDARNRGVGDYNGARERLNKALEPFTRLKTQVSVPAAPTAHIATSRKVP